METRDGGGGDEGGQDGDGFPTIHCRSLQNSVLDPAFGLRVLKLLDSDRRDEMLAELSPTLGRERD